MAFGCSALLLAGRKGTVCAPEVRRGEAAPPAMPCAGRTVSRIGELRPSIKPSESARADFACEGVHAALLCAYGACPGPPHGHCALMVEIAGKTPAITESAA